MLLPHTVLVCSKDAGNGSAAGSVSCRGEQCSAHPNPQWGAWPASPAGNKCRISLLTVLIKAEKLKLLCRLIKKTPQKQLKYFLNVHLPLISLAFHALICSKFSPSSLFFPTALWNSSVWNPKEEHCSVQFTVAQHHPFCLSHCNYILREQKWRKTEPQFEYNQFVFAAA